MTAVSSSMHHPNSDLQQAAEMLSEWERARPAGSPLVTPELRYAFNQFVAEVVSETQENNLDIADVQEVLRRAAGLSIGCAEASGPGRAQRALHEAHQTTQAIGPDIAPQGQILLSVQSRLDIELEISELIDITETMQRNAGPGWEIYFGHGIAPGLAAEIRVMFLLAPSCAQ